MSEQKNAELQSETSAVTKPSLAAGLGFPMDRKEASAEPTGWIVRKVEEESGNVSRGTSK